MGHSHDVLVIGGGAAGLMCALTAGRRGKRVLLVEHANRVGKKILMSGGGRCNFTNTGTTPANYLSANPHYCKSALARYTPCRFHRDGRPPRHRLAREGTGAAVLRRFVEADREDAAGRMRSRRRAHRNQLQRGDACSTPTPVSACARRAARYRRRSLVVACGGLSIPSMGASGFGYELARQFGHTVLPTRAGLVPLTLTGKHQEHLQDLSGVALPVEASCNGREFPQFHADHPPRGQRPFDPADLFLLAARRRPAPGPAAGTGRSWTCCNGCNASGRLPS